MVWDGDWGDGLPEGGDWDISNWGDGLPLGPSPSGPTPPTPAEWKVEVLIDDEIVWSATTSVSQRTASFNVARFRGRKNLKFKLTRTS